MLRKRANAGPDDWEIPQALLDVSLGAMQYQALSASPLKLYAGLVLWSVMDFIYDNARIAVAESGFVRTGRSIKA